MRACECISDYMTCSPCRDRIEYQNYLKANSLYPYSISKSKEAN